MRGPRAGSATVALAAAVVLIVSGCASSKHSGSAAGGGASSSSTPVSSAPSGSTAAAAPGQGGYGGYGAAPTTVPATGTAITTEPVALVARNFQFSVAALRVRSGQPVTIHYTDADHVKHNLTVAKANVSTDVLPGTTATITFTAPAPGTYEFHCAFHPKVMRGTLTVV